jgi:hypothetical protein
MPASMPVELWALLVRGMCAGAHILEGRALEALLEGWRGGKCEFLEKILYIRSVIRGINTNY